MDTSEQYIAMVNCPQIRDGWEPKVGDVCYHLKSGISGKITKLYPDPIGEMIVLSSDCSRWQKPYKKKDLIWLPRLDQLLTMLKKNYWGIRHRGDVTHFVLWDCKEGTWFSTDTPEQAVLQGVMHELHGLKWDGGKWE